MGNFMKKVKLLAIALLVGGATVGCGLLGDSPEAGARDIMNSMVSGNFDQIKGRVCSAKQGEIKDEQLKEAKEQFKQVADKVKIDTSGVNFSSEVNGDTATVTVSGKIKVEAEGNSTELSIEKAPAELRKFKMVKEGGSWKICPDTNFNLPGL
jgi:hypothetical protein